MLYLETTFSIRVYLNSFLKLKSQGGEAMPHGLRAYIPFGQDLSSVPTIHIQQVTTSCSRGSNPHMHIIKNKSIKRDLNLRVSLDQIFAVYRLSVLPYIHSFGSPLRDRKGLWLNSNWYCICPTWTRPQVQLPALGLSQVNCWEQERTAGAEQNSFSLMQGVFVLHFKYRGFVIFV